MKKLYFNNLKIRTKMLLIYAFCVLLPIILTDSIILYNMNKSDKESQLVNLSHAMDRVEYNLNSNIDNCIMFTNNMYYDRDLNKFLNKQYADFPSYYDAYMKMLNGNKLSYTYNAGLLSKIELFADNNSIIGGGKISRLSSVEDETWYKEFKESEKDIFVYPYYDVAKKFLPGSGSARTISIIRKLDYFGNRGIEKLLKIDMDYNMMLMDVLNEKIDGTIYVRNKDDILFSNLPNTSGARDFPEASTLDGIKPVMSKFFSVGNDQWEVVVYAEKIPFWSILFRNKWLLAIVLLDLFLPTILIYFVGKSISHRLSIVATYMGRVEKEQFDLITTTEGEDEVGKLIRSYNMMVTRIKDLIEVVFKENAEKQALELSKKQAELKAIQSQVNPHFLFNTLESIRMRSLIKGEDETANIIGELAILFRKSMNWGPDSITIEEEMNFIEKYINIQKYRYGDKIKFYHYVMEGCERLLIPKLSIGTFVENACVHGIETTANEGVISLTITKNEQFLFIEISDNGKGFDEENLRKIRWMITNADTKMLNESKSTGMLNAFLRLKMFCEGQIIFDIDSKKEDGTDITIQIPLEMVRGDSDTENHVKMEETSDD
jgi:two-component system sensor histidine kinase YesM